MPYSVSVCITTCDRVDLLKEAIASCLAQTLLPNEIVIGDDSRLDETETIVRQLIAGTTVPISYQRNTPRLGQNANINSVFQRARGSHLVLLHDDDLLLPNAIHDLSSCWNQYPDLTGAFGKQYVISHDGKRDLAASEALNRTYHRTPDKAGIQPHAVLTGLTQQFPNDCYMITTSAARNTLWRSTAEVGNGGDFDFGLRLGLSNGKLYFLDVYTAEYRLTQGVSISRSRKDDFVLQTYRIARSAKLPSDCEQARVRKLASIAPLATLQAIRTSRKREAWTIFRSPNYRWRDRLSLRGLRNLLLLLK